MKILRPITLEDLLTDCEQKVSNPDDFEIILSPEAVLDIARRMLALEAKSWHTAHH